MRLLGQTAMKALDEFFAHIVGAELVGEGGYKGALQVHLPNGQSVGAAILATRFVFRR